MHVAEVPREVRTLKAYGRQKKDCANGEISGMVVTRRVPSPSSLRHLLQVASASASIVGKRVLHVKHGRSASSRVRVRRDESLCCGRRPTCCGMRLAEGKNDASQIGVIGAAPRVRIR